MWSTLQMRGLHYDEYLADSQRYAACLPGHGSSSLAAMFTGVFTDRTQARLGPARTPEQVLQRLLQGPLAAFWQQNPVTNNAIHPQTNRLQ